MAQSKARWRPSRSLALRRPYYIMGRENIARARSAPALTALIGPPGLIYHNPSASGVFAYMSPCCPHELLVGVNYSRLLVAKTH